MPHRFIDGAAVIMDVRNREGCYILNVTTKIQKRLLTSDEFWNIISVELEEALYVVGKMLKQTLDMENYI